jgi:hypothetical protein
MKEIIIPHAVVRESGYLYYIDAVGNICRAKMQRMGRVKEVVEMEVKD